MIGTAEFASLERAQEAVTNWANLLPADRRALLETAAAAQELTRLSYVDGYLRIRRTVPLILHAIERLDGLGRRSEAAFWIDHLKEEAFHDEIMRADLARLLGGDRATQTLRDARMTPPSAALLGYFEQQVAFGDPALLIALRLFLEWYMAGLEGWRVAQIDALVDGGSQIIATHKALDGDHVGPCNTYIAAHCGDCRPELHWSIVFTGRCLGDSQLYLAERMLERAG